MRVRSFNGTSGAWDDGRPVPLPDDVSARLRDAEEHGVAASNPWCAHGGAARNDSAVAGKMVGIDIEVKRLSAIGLFMSGDVAPGSARGCEAHSAFRALRVPNIELEFPTYSHPFAGLAVHNKRKTILHQSNERLDGSCLFISPSRQVSR